MNRDILPDMTIRPALRTSIPTLVSAASTFLISCAAPVILSGADLPPGERAEIRAGTGIRIRKVEGAEVEGRRFELAPGSYSIELSSKRDVKKVEPVLAGVIAELECKVDLDLQPGEKVFVSARLRRDKARLRGGYEFSGFRSEVRLDSSVEGQSRILESDECVGHLDCRKLDRLQVVGMDCDAIE